MKCSQWMKRCSVFSVMCVALGLLASKEVSAAMLEAHWTGAGDGSSYDDPDNWDDAGGVPLTVVPVNAGSDTWKVFIPTGTVHFNHVDPADPAKTFDVWQLSLGSNATLVADPGRKLNVQDKADIAGRVYTSAGLFTAGATVGLPPSPVSMFTGNKVTLGVENGGTLQVLSGTAYDSRGADPSAVVLSSDGAGSSLDLSTVQED